MALRGTLGDFGIADIFQLVGHQTKTGMLLLKNREVEVRIYFVEGNVVKAEQSSRDKRDLLGAMMVRAGVLTEAQLEDALSQQQRTMRRLGDILVDSGYVDRRTLKEFTRLQTTETIYRLFTWEAGTYEFQQQEVDYDEQSYDPIRAESILMEGFRMVDEWPSVREVIPTNQVTFTVLTDPPPAPEGGGDDDDLLAGLDAAFSEDGGGDDAPEGIGPNERKVFALVEPERTVETLIDLSRLGEFETCKALSNLVKSGYLKAHVPDAPGEVEGARSFTPAALLEHAVPIATRAALYIVLAAAVGGVVRLASGPGGAFGAEAAPQARRDDGREVLGAVQERRLSRAIEVYRLLEGRYPASLEALVEAGLVEEEALRYPYRERFAYRVAKSSYELAPPLR